MRTIITTLLVLVTLMAYGQADSTKTKKKDNRISLHGTVADGFTKAAVRDVKATLMRADSTVVDTMKVWESYNYSSGIGRSAGTTYYHFSISREPARYIIKLEHPNYDTAYTDFELKQAGRRRQDIEGPKVYLKKAAHASHFTGGDLDEVVVKATKVKMIWRGDTLVFNADAFNVPEGSMLDGLIKQLPGVELKDNGEIFVNGKKIDNLTLNGADFFRGKNKIMLQNLPYFTVKNVEVYKKQTEENKYLGIDDEDKKEYTMNVNLKREYRIGGSATLEGGYGTDDRYKLKGFGLRFSDHTRAVVFGGMNNINETIEYSGEESSYNDNFELAGDSHFKQVGGQFVYQAPEDKLTNSTEVKATWNNDFSETRSQSETYMNGASTFGHSEGRSRNKPVNFSLGNTFRTRGKVNFYSNTELKYNRNRDEGDGWSVSTADAVMKDSINSSWYRSRNQYDRLSGSGYGYLAYRMPTGDSFIFNMQGSFNRNYHSESTSLNHYAYHHLGTNEDRDRRTVSPSHSSDYEGSIRYNYQLSESFRLSPSIGLGINDNQSDRHEYLRDSIDYLFDAKNSYEQRTQILNRRASLDFGFNKNWKSCYFGMGMNLGVNYQRKKMSYNSQPLSTTLIRNYMLFSPNVYLYGMSEKQDFTLQYYIWSSTPDVTDLIDRPITSDPLNIFLGNPNLKKSEQHIWYGYYNLRNDSIDQTIRLSFNASLNHNSRTQGYTYDMTTGVRTFRPENIGSGNWNLGTSINWNRSLGRQKFWHIGSELSFRYTRNTSLTLTTGSTDDEMSRVGSLLTSYKPVVSFQKNNLTLKLKGDFTYRNIHRNIITGEQPTDIWDIAYGINGSYKFPWNITLDTDFTMHSRRGYTDKEMNDNRLYWDAALTKSIHQGQWVIKLRGYDLLGQVSNLHYNINAQGRTETWTNSMRRYALLTISYRFSQKPKKGNE